MLHRTASPLSVIGSTCTVKPRVKQSRHNQQALHLLSPWVWGATFWSRPSGRPQCIELTDLALHVKLSSMGQLYRVSCESFKPSDWNLSDNWESAEEGGLDIKSEMLWEHMQLLYCTFATVCDVWTGQAMDSGQKYHQLLHHCKIA